MPQWNSAEFPSFKSPMTSLSRVIKEKQMFSKVLLMLFGWKFLMMHWTNCHQAEKSVRKWLNQNSILSFQMLTGIHKQDTRSKSHRILLLLLIEVHLQRVMSMFYLYLLTITTQLLEQWALLTREYYLPFDSVSGTFDVHSGRSHFKLLISQHNRQSNMGELKRKFRSWERKIDRAID